ncbi:MAG: helix-turn-helix transcriptional regulator [Prochloraceae cyanobacterium]|nr:helix-turn-helix transcriptional regulator [Prochloraceae cyanobacterium]
MPRPKKGQPQNTDSPFKQLRLAAGLSQEDLVRLMGVSVSSISRWERGEAEPTMTVYQMKAFCKAVNRSLDELPDSLLPPELASQKKESKE